ncbi:unnamed protein product [Sphagnum troendelagicum]|uniref:Uncharacterized protein n=1 Tax=Sphagnum troendelagicum TaxID=128251 RepID=A0ABP0TNF5_9BRYO
MSHVKTIEHEFWATSINSLEATVVGVAPMVSGWQCTSQVIVCMCYWTLKEQGGLGEGGQKPIDWAPIDTKRIVLKLNLIKEHLSSAILSGCLAGVDVGKELVNLYSQKKVVPDANELIQVDNYNFEISDTSLHLAPQDTQTELAKKTTSTFNGQRMGFEFVSVSEQTPVRKMCNIPNSEFKEHHEGAHSHSQTENVQHNCELPMGHLGPHQTTHGNMRGVHFVYESEILTFVSASSYKWGESGAVEMCAMIAGHWVQVIFIYYHVIMTNQYLK